MTAARGFNCNVIAVLLRNRAYVRRNVSGTESQSERRRRRSTNGISRYDVLAQVRNSLSGDILDKTLIFSTVIESSFNQSLRVGETNLLFQEIRRFESLSIRAIFD